MNLVTVLAYMCVRKNNRWTKHEGVQTGKKPESEIAKERERQGENEREAEEEIAREWEGES